jgi:hypothetical protein
MDNIESRLNDLKSSFTKIVNIKNDDLITFEALDKKINKLKEIYLDFINANKNNLFVFGLDSFHFQSKLIDIEYDEMKRLFLAITNRMYCEYYKLFKIIILYVTEAINDKKLLEFIKINDKFPIYKDLEPFKQYDFELIQNLHELLINILKLINDVLINKKHELEIYQTKNKIGISIDNFVNTFNYNNIIMREKIILFITYMEFFHKLHEKYFKRFTTKLQLMYSQITHDIKLEDTEKSKKNKNKNMLIDLESEEIDKSILLELKASINDSSTDSESGIVSRTESEVEIVDYNDSPISKNIEYDNFVSFKIEDFFESTNPLKLQTENIKIDIEENLIENDNEIGIESKDDNFGV